jgi:Ca2+-binding EF-hand superfamily protein
MDLRYTKNELQDLYTYMDTDGGGTIGYNEFTKLLDEKRMGIDPYTNQQQDGDEMDVFYKNQQLFDQERFKGKNQSKVVNMH